MTIRLVHCHVGSLEKSGIPIGTASRVHCHVGSLEIKIDYARALTYVHCHVGSLEMFNSRKLSNI